MSLCISSCIYLFTLQVPNYYKIITHPMDLSTIKTKLLPHHPHHYKNVSELVDDVQLIFSNCALFNPVSQLF